MSYVWETQNIVWVWKDHPARFAPIALIISSLWKWKRKSFSCVRLFVTPWTMQSFEFSKPEYWVGSGSLLQGIFPNQGSNSGFLHCRWILYHLSYQGSHGISGVRKVSHPYNRLLFLIFPQGFQLICKTTSLLFSYLDF